jgi:hypothetical protein
LLRYIGGVLRTIPGIYITFLKALQHRYYHLQVLDVKTEAEKRLASGIGSGLGNYKKLKSTSA